MTKNELIKLKNKLLALSIATTLSVTLTGCNDEKISEDIDTSYVLEHDTEKELDQRDIYKTFSDEIDDIDVVYPYQEYYQKKDEIEYIYKRSIENDDSCEVSFDGDISGVVEKIIDNTSFYLDNNNVCAYSFFETSDFNAKNMLKNILTNIFYNSKNDIDEDMHKIDGLKILCLNEETDCLGKYVPDENLILIYLDEIYKTYGNEDINKYVELTLAHEINHAREEICSCKTQKYSNLTFSYNSFSSLEESAAESELYNVEGYKMSDYSDYTYSEERIDEALIILLGLFNNKNIYDYYDCIFDTDYDKFYEYCDTCDYSDVQLLYKIIYAIDSKYKRTNFKNNFSTSSNMRQLVGNNYKLDIFKKVLKQMITYTKKNNISVDENISLFIIVENIITNYYDNANYSDDFIGDFLEMEELYTQFLVDEYDINYEYITNYRKENEEKLLLDLISLAELDECYYGTNAYDLMEKFPLLKAIVYPNIINLSHSYNDFKKKVK